MGRRYLAPRDTSEYSRCAHESQTFIPHSRYFGRAKDLPGVKELFQSKKQEQDEENQAQNYYKKFTNRGPSYFGDLDETDEGLLTFEQRAEQDGMEIFTHSLVIRSDSRFQ